MKVVSIITPYRRNPAPARLAPRPVSAALAERPPTPFPPISPPVSFRRWHAAPVVAVVVTATLIAGARLYGPSDVYDKDQCKTIGYTADIVHNGRWLLPRDTLGQQATKPPLYNWIGAAVVLALDSHDEFAFRLPSLFSAAVVAWLIARAAGRSSQADDGVSSARSDRPGAATAAAALAVAFWLASPPVMKYLYLARPDMLMTAFVTAAWACGTRALIAASSGRVPATRVVACFWACVAGAALAKGPAAMLPVLYVVAASRLLFGGFSTLCALRWHWGVPLALALVGAWLVPATMLHGDHVYRVMLRGEVFDRLLTGTPELRAANPWWLVPVWFLATFAPWSATALLALTQIRDWRRSPLAPSALWLLIGLGFFACSAGKRADYLLPVLPQASVLAACWLVGVLNRAGLECGRALIVPALFACGLCLNHMNHTREAQEPHADNMARFAAACRAAVGQDALILLVDGYHPFLPLIGRAGELPTEQSLARAAWVVCPHQPKWRAELVSGMVPDADAGKAGVIALYRMPREPERLREAGALLRRVTKLNGIGRRNPASSAPGKTTPARNR